MSWQAVREHEIAMGHRVYGHEGKCAHLHGHNYTFEFYVAKDTPTPALELDEVGRVIDFGVIKSLLCEWLERYWDHKFMVWRQDPIWSKLVQEDPKGVVVVPFNPTAENIAQYFVEDVAPGLLLGTFTKLVQLRLWETGKCSAIYTEETSNGKNRSGRERAEQVL